MCRKVRHSGNAAASRGLAASLVTMAPWGFRCRASLPRRPKPASSSSCRPTQWSKRAISAILAGDVDVHGRPAAVFRGNFRSMGVRRVGADVELRLAHHARLADPARERAQEAEVVVDGRGGEATFQPPRHHGFDVAVGQLPRIEVAVRRLVAQLAEKADHHALSVVHGLERHALVLLAVLAVVLREVGADDAQVVGGAHRQRCEDDVGVRRGTRRWTPRMGVGSRQSVVQRARRVLR
jgi:hypothetical protein